MDAALEVVQMLVVELEPLAVEEVTAEEEVTADEEVTAEEEVAAVEEVAAELLEVTASVQLLEAKAATPSANAVSNGWANEAARDWARAGTRATMASMRA